MKKEENKKTNQQPQAEGIRDESLAHQPGFLAWREFINEMNIVLSGMQVFRQKLLNFHWNVSGDMFFELHEVYEEMYNEVGGEIDEVAERIKSLGHTPLVTMRAYLEASEVKEAAADLSPREMMKEIRADLEKMLERVNAARELATDLNDAATIHLLNKQAFAFEKRSWMIRSWLGAKSN